MKRIFATITGLLLAIGVAASPMQDLTRLRTFYQQRFPGLSLSDYADGVYAIDAIARESWQAIEEFPPYEPALEAGKTAFYKTFADGKSYADCFPNQGIGIAQHYPIWDAQQKQVITLAKAINDCRLRHHEAPLPWKKGKISHILAYMAYTSRGKAIDIRIPADDPQALVAYNAGKRYYYQRRGQLNFSCASCHIQNAGRRIRSETLSPMLGQVSGWPAYRLKWGEMGTLHRRFIGCHKQIRAKIPDAQSIELRNLEYFMSFISNGVPVNGPSTRK